MKTIYFIIVFLGLQFNIILAAASIGGSPVLSDKTSSAVTHAVLVPVAPAEATFEDEAEVNASVIHLSGLIPVIPMVADFSDGAPVTETSQISVAPVTPREADFEEGAETGYNLSVKDLAPVTPANADFENPA